jgi:2-polyprenyl-3-methyl-5-hydroxy-6-metoxy-1,4-benzoquinol methylase
MDEFNITPFRETLPEKAKKYFDDHKKRFLLSLKWINSIIDTKSCVLEIGSKNMFSVIINNNIQCGEYHNTNQDLRKQIEYPDSMFDVILFMEVIEHVKDIEETDGYNETFYGTGQLNIIKECYRLLKSGGYLFLTTPNLNSIHSLKKLMAFEHPFVYWPHIREMSINDVKNYLKETGFIIEKIGSESSWYHITDIDKMLIEDLKKYGFSDEYREDNLFVIAKKV